MGARPRRPNIGGSADLQVVDSAVTIAGPGEAFDEAFDADASRIEKFLALATMLNRPDRD